MAHLSGRNNLPFTYGIIPSHERVAQHPMKSSTSIPKAAKAGDRSHPLDEFEAIRTSRDGSCKNVSK